jgi:hypothetical protein
MKKQFSGTEIVGKLRQADIFIAQGTTFCTVRSQARQGF